MGNLENKLEEIEGYLKLVDEVLLDREGFELNDIFYDSLRYTIYLTDYLLNFALVKKENNLILKRFTNSDDFFILLASNWYELKEITSGMNYEEVEAKKESFDFRKFILDDTKQKYKENLERIKILEGEFTLLAKKIAKVEGFERPDTKRSVLEASCTDEEAAGYSINFIHGFLNLVVKKNMIPCELARNYFSGQKQFIEIKKYFLQQMRESYSVDNFKLDGDIDDVGKQIDNLFNTGPSFPKYQK